MKPVPYTTEPDYEAPTVLHLAAELLAAALVTVAFVGTGYYVFGVL